MIVYFLWALSLLLLRAGRTNFCFQFCKCNKKSDDDETEDGCCLTCYNSIYAKGGCCTRNMLCGWMAGKPPKLPTMHSLKREEELKRKKLVKESMESIKKSVVSGASGVKTGLESIQNRAHNNSSVVAETSVVITAEENNHTEEDSITSTTIISNNDANRQEGPYLHYASRSYFSPSSSSSFAPPYSSKDILESTTLSMEQRTLFR